MEDFPSIWLVCLDFKGKATERVQNFQERDKLLSPNCMTIDSQGNVYTSDSDFTFSKFRHDRYFDHAYQRSTDRMTRMWEFRDVSIGASLQAQNSRACGVAVDCRNEDILYAAFSKGPILLIHTTDAKLIGKINPDPPFKCVSSMCCCSDVLVVGDSHQIKIFDMEGSQISVLGQLYNDPCLIWTGLELYVGERRSTVWHCYQSKAAHGIELSRQHEKCLRYTTWQLCLFCCSSSHVFI